MNYRGRAYRNYGKYVVGGIALALVPGAIPLATAFLFLENIRKISERNYSLDREARKNMRVLRHTCEKGLVKKID